MSSESEGSSIAPPAEPGICTTILLGTSMLPTTCWGRWKPSHDFLMSDNYRIAQNLGEIGTARKLVQKTLAIGRGKAHSILEFMKPHNFLADKTLADWQ